MFESRRYRRKPVLACLLMPSVSSDIDGFGEFGELTCYVTVNRRFIGLQYITHNNLYCIA